MHRGVLATCAVEVQEGILVAAGALTSNVTLETELRFRSNMALMHVSPQLLCLVLQFRLQIVKGTCLLRDGVVELGHFIGLLANCLAPGLSKRIEILDIFLSLFELALEIVLGLLQLLDCLVLLLVLTSESITLSLLDFELCFKGGDTSGELNDLSGLSLETSFGSYEISSRLVKLLLYLSLGSSFIVELRD
jgi:hypothetical protein